MISQKHFISKNEYQFFYLLRENNRICDVDSDVDQLYIQYSRNAEMEPNITFFFNLKLRILFLFP